MQFVKLIESLADCSVDQGKMPDFHLASVACRTKFRNSKLYSSFVNAKVDATLERALKATDADERIALLQSIQDVPFVPNNAKHTIRVVSTLFDTRAPLLTRIEYIANATDQNDLPTIKLAMQWDPNGIIGFAAMCLSSEKVGDLSGKQVAHLETFAELALASECDITVPNPLISQAIQFVQSVYDLEKTPNRQQGAWTQVAVASALEARFDLEVEEDIKNRVLEFDPELLFPAKLHKEIVKIFKEFFKTSKEQPDWFAQWKAKRAALAAEKKGEHGGDAEEEAETEVEEHERAEGEQVNGEGAEQEHAGGAADASETAPAPGAAAPDPDKFKVGDVVIGVATKHKEQYDQQRCEVIAVLSKHYKVKMLTGVEKNQQHKYLHASVKAAEKPEAPAAPAPQDVAPPPPEPEGDGAATPEPEQPAEGAVGDKASESEDIQELTQSVFP